MKPVSIVLGFGPLLIFSLVAKRLAENGVAWAAVLGIALVLLSMVLSPPVWPPSVLNVATLAPFAVIAIAGFAGGSGVDAWLSDWAVPSIALVIGLVVLVTVPFAPFTARFAKQSTPREYWGSPTFKKINTVLSAVWGVAIMAIGLSHLLLTVLVNSGVGADGSRLPELLLNWAVPIAIVVWTAKFTAAYPDRVTGDSTNPAVSASTAH